ncbi:uncharacterized protein spi2 isoform X3 [Epinephelus moara]|uniref:uncharacterized protein spi2 isoform X3 n=1 Tax=Epinephelus moara TaxID=300413 RepID=UPI00214F03C9|nr:uncharacterized protein spi2 isoform X3 [Epinephelus moara]
MNSLQDSQSDLEVILEFLEEYYRQNAGDNVDKVNWAAGEPVDERSAPVDESSEQRWMCYGPPWTFKAVSLHHFLYHRSSNLHFSLCWHTTPRHLSARTQQQHCVSMGHCQTLYQQDNQPNTQWGVVERCDSFTFCLRCWRIQTWPTVCPGCQQQPVFSASLPRTRTRWQRCGGRERATRGP